MSIRIGTSTASMAAQTALLRTQREAERTVKNLASGSRLADPSADVASLAISEKMGSEIRSLGAAQLNADSAVGFVSVAEGSLAEQTNILTRMRELSIQAASDTFTDVERGFMNKEFVQLRDELDRIAKTTQYGDQKLLNGSSKEYEFQVGSSKDENSRITFSSEADTTASGLSLKGLSISDRGDARDSLQDIDEAMKSISGVRAQFGATQTRLESASNNLQVNIENLSAARSTLADADVAKEISNLRRNQVLQQYQTAVLRQANDSTGLVLNLIG